MSRLPAWARWAILAIAGVSFLQITFQPQSRKLVQKLPTCQAVLWTFQNTLGTPIYLSTPDAGSRLLDTAGTWTFAANRAESFTYREADGRGDWGSATISRNAPATDCIDALTPQVVAP